MATRSAVSSLPARLRPTSAATAGGGWRRFLSDAPTNGRKDEDKGLEDPKMVEGLPMASTEIPAPAENEENCLKDRLEQSMKEIKRLQYQLEKVEAEKQQLKDLIHKELEAIVTKQTIQFETKLANHRMHIDKSTRKLLHRSEEFKAFLMKGVAFLKGECSRRAKAGEEGTKVLKETNVKFQDELIGKVQKAQYNVVKTTALTAVALGAVILFVLQFKRGG